MSIERKFGFCEITWDIENFCLAPARKEWTFSSPDFCVRGPELTKWRMIIKRKPAAESDYDISFILKRLKCGNYFEEVGAEFHVKCFAVDGDDPIERFKAAGRFRVNSELTQVVDSAALCCRYDGSSYIYRTRCDILVTFQNIETGLRPSTNLRIKFLGKRLLDMYNAALTDCTLTFGDKKLDVHKVVVHHRIKNAKLRDSILNGTAPVNYPVDDVDKFFMFLYSGNLNYAVENPTVSVYKMALDFGVQPIIDYYKPDGLELLTVCHAEVEQNCSNCQESTLYIEIPGGSEFIWTIPINRNGYNCSNCQEHPIYREIPEENEFIWTVPNYFNRSSKALYSPYLTNGNKNIKWRWILYPKVVTHGKRHPCVVLEIETGIRALCCNISFSSSGKPFYGTHEAIRENEEVFPCEAISSHDEMESYLKDGNLTIFFRLRFLTSATYNESKVIGKETVKSNQLTEESIYNQFHEDLIRMREDDEHTPLLSEKIAKDFGLDIYEFPE